MSCKNSYCGGCRALNAICFSPWHSPPGFREWMPKWLKSGFIASNGKPVKNAPLIRYLSALLDQRAREGQKVRPAHFHLFCFSPPLCVRPTRSTFST